MNVPDVISDCIFSSLVERFFCWYSFPLLASSYQFSLPYCKKLKKPLFRSLISSFFVSNPFPSVLSLSRSLWEKLFLRLSTWMSIRDPLMCSFIILIFFLNLSCKYTIVNYNILDVESTETSRFSKLNLNIWTKLLKVDLVISRIIT
jgi:hypothetical protein